MIDPNDDSPYYTCEDCESYVEVCCHYGVCIHDVQEAKDKGTFDKSAQIIANEIGWMMLDDRHETCEKFGLYE